MLSMQQRRAGALLVWSELSCVRQVCPLGTFWVLASLDCLPATSCQWTGRYFGTPKLCTVAPYALGDMRCRKALSAF